MKLVVGFLTYNDASARYLSDFLPSLKESLASLNSEDYRVIAFDNSDKNQLANKEKIEQFNKINPYFIEYLSTDNNLGFSRAYNILIRLAVQYSADYFLIINPDIVLERDALVNLISVLDQDQSLGSVSPKIRRWDFASNTKTRVIDSCGLIVSPGLRFRDLGQGEKDNKQFDKQAIIGPSGAAGLFRLKDLEKVKENGSYFDEHFFMYKEDCDLAYRLYLKGVKSSLVPEAIIYHDRTAFVSGGGLLTRIINRGGKSRQIRSWSFTNQHYLFIKHWFKQDLISKMVIFCQVLLFGFFSLILEQFLLKDYRKIFNFYNIGKDVD